MLDTLPFAFPVAPNQHQVLPDVAFAVLPLLERLRDALQLAAEYHDRVRRRQTRSRWGVPRLFFFEPDLQTEWEAVRSVENSSVAPFDPVLARREPIAAQAWDTVTNLTDDALSVLAASADARRTARVVPGLIAAASALAADHPRARELAEVLELVEDEVIRVIHPTARTGFRVMTHGVADIYQFHALLAEVVTGDPARGRLPGPRPDPQVLSAYRGPSSHDEPILATARFQFYRPSALQPDGTLPTGFAGTGHWLFGPERLKVLPRLEDERTVLIGPPAFAAAWEVDRVLPRVNAKLEVVEVLSPAAVARWLERQTGRTIEDARSAIRSAA